ncbi:hypothetical protein FNV43_RR12522 [Rhamnella rubrinervis]|uniref:Potassium channel domain-containing protein n=1 Tax=Rhamnella rubrinervis TaxID=2594499 RepID=A0A8K0MIK4_9ROSA|nr:hypothetical protein FNV43_RR12522 [Rhamnella rubrinervis]
MPLLGMKNIERQKMKHADFTSKVGDGVPTLETKWREKSEHITVDMRERVHSPPQTTTSTHTHSPPTATDTAAKGTTSTHTHSPPTATDDPGPALASNVNVASSHSLTRLLLMMAAITLQPSHGDSSTNPRPPPGDPDSPAIPQPRRRSMMRMPSALLIELWSSYLFSFTAASRSVFHYLATIPPPPLSECDSCATWLTSLELRDGIDYSDITNVAKWKRYFMSLYFALITMSTVGYGAIHPVNFIEMVFAGTFVVANFVVTGYLSAMLAVLIEKLSTFAPDKSSTSCQEHSRGDWREKIAAQE